MKYTLLCLIVLSLVIQSSAQNFEYYEDFKGTELADRVYRNTIKSVKLSPINDEYAPPIVKFHIGIPHFFFECPI